MPTKHHEKDKSREAQKGNNTHNNAKKDSRTKAEHEGPAVAAIALLFAFFASLVTGSAFMADETRNTTMSLLTTQETGTVTERSTQTFGTNLLFSTDRTESTRDTGFRTMRTFTRTSLPTV